MKFLKTILLLPLLIAATVCFSQNNPLRPSDYVDPFIGASTNTKDAGAHHGLGKTFPGAASPFGMVQLSPNTITGGDNGPGYSHEHTSIEGFAFTQMSGIGWYGDLGNFLTMPTTGKLKTISGTLDHPDEGYRSRYDKATETAKAGYYAADLTDYGIKAEATVTPHAGMLRFTYPANKQSRIQIDLARRVAGSSAWQTVKVIDDHTISGKMECTPKEGGWGNGGGNARYTVYYYAQFSKPLKNQGVWSADIPEGNARKMADIAKDEYKALVANAKIIRGKKEYAGKQLGFFTEFETKKDEQVLMKVGISFVSEEGAEKNLKAEITHWDFDKVHEQMRTTWDKALGKMTVSGGTDAQKTIFYTALYHTMIDPRMFSDVDGKYPGGDDKIHETTYFNKRTIFSGWDVFRSQMPLQTIINPKVISDMINSLVTLAEESGKGYLERWEFLNAYSGCMLGNPAISVIADAYAKGIRDFDITKAYQYAVSTTEKFGNSSLGYSASNISATLEYAYNEWCMSELARSLGKEADRAKYLKLSKSYQNTWDKEMQWFRPRKADGSFEPLPPKGRLQDDYGSTESNPYQQGWFVPHDINGLISLIGSREATVADLDAMFANTPSNMLWNSYYNHANEPVHHIPFMYNRLNEPWKTQKWARFICEHAYKTGVKGLVGNEDVGQMSAWYVLAASGIHPICPGETRFEITTPVFEQIEFNLDNGKKFIISTVNNSPENTYIQSAKLNGNVYDKCYLDYSDIMEGGQLELVLGNQPNVKWGIEPDLKFHSNGKFKVIQVTDTHIKVDSVQSLATVEMLNQVLDAEKPDLVIFSGDIITGKTYKAGLDLLVEPVVSRKIPWAAVFGNHDREQDLSYEQMADLMDSYPYNVGKMKKLENVDGYGNYTIEINASASDKTEAVIYCLDSHTYVTLPDGKGDDAHITFNQISWYRNLSDNYTKANNGKPLQALTFFHIPLLEYRDAYLEKGHKVVGTHLEDVCSPEINSGFLTAMIEKGDVMGVFTGHDHLNDYIFNRWGIALAYGRFSGSKTTYGHLKNGVRVIELTEGHHDFDTWIRLDSNTVIDKVNFPRDLPLKIRDK